MARLVPMKHALMDTPEYENAGEFGFEKSIRPVYSINPLFAGIVSKESAKHRVEEMSEIISKKNFILHHFSSTNFSNYFKKYTTIGYF
jgi:hypothetical protein